MLNFEEKGRCIHKKGVCVYMEIVNYALILDVPVKFAFQVGALGGGRGRGGIHILLYNFSFTKTQNENKNKIYNVFHIL